MSPAINKLLFVVAAFIIAAPVLADPPGRVGRLSLVSGSVSLAPAGVEDEWSEAYINRPITTGDRLWTADRGRAEIRIGSAAVRLDVRTSADVLGLDDRYVQLRLAEGRLQLRIRSIPRDGFYEIDTPSAAVVIREPGIYRIEVRPDADVTTVVVREGAAQIAGNRSSLEVYRGERVVFENGGEAYDYTSIAQQDDFDRFYVSRDSRDERRATRYVSLEMTGYEDLDEYGSWSAVPDYGNVWFPTRIETGWTPYRDGRWVWVEPWGYTWVDNAPWGFAPFHYGRWVRVRDRWGWCPGEVVAQPIYAPALVAWVGGPSFSVGISSGTAPVVGWFPLAYREPYIPWYETSPTYIREVNVPARVTNINITNINVTQINYQHRQDPAAVTAVPSTVVAQAQPVTRAVVAIQPQRLAQASVVTGAAPVPPASQSVIVRPAAARPPPQIEKRAVVAVQTPPPAPPSFSARQQAIAQHGAQPYKVQALPPRAASATAPGITAPAAPAGGAAAPSAPGKAPTAPAGAAPAATAAATVAPVQLIKPAPAQARTAGAPPPTRAAGTPTPGTAAAPPGKAPTERAGAAPGATTPTPGTAATAPPGPAQGRAAAPEGPKVAAEPPKAAEAAKAAPQPPKGPAETAKSAESAKGAEAAKGATELPKGPADAPKGAAVAPKGPAEAPKGAAEAPKAAPPTPPSAERPGPGRGAEAERATPQRPGLAPSDVTPPGAPSRAAPAERAAPRAVPPTPPQQMTPPGAERAAPREAPLTTRAAPPTPERAAPATPERAPPAPRAVPPTPPERATPQERAAPREAAPAPRAVPPTPPERPAPPTPERAAPATPRAAPPAPPAERAAPREAPAPQRGGAPAERAGEGKGPPEKGKGPPEKGKSPPEKGKSPDEKRQEEQRG